ncbi:Mce/MlaD family protein [Aeromicrobium wangtongii]|uniref:Uncharacterized protein n=1 Tax=Aeromicrobium wangtongii TaxID=2969247 RepID=A0ABY5MC78_9ACTN|nr:hypothetical protein [Aeromicrobium wangtongii]MCD9197570.1 hypothetical protein [Aeromicrobium wangtongii]UUP15062.1 hypothetical protein NQV15_07040 [Aeromicrobium wangtongii]
MPLHAVLVSGPIGPDTIDLPGEPARLREAVQGLRDLTRQLGQVSEQLQQANPPQGSRGRTVLALSRGAQRAGTALEADARQLGELADSIEAAADALAQGQDGLDGLRQRWRAARQGLRQALQDAKGGPHDPGALIRRIDAHTAEPHDAQFRRQAGLSFTDGGGGAQAEAMLLEQGGALQQAIGEYRREVRGIVDEYADLMQKAKNADNDVDRRLPRRAEASLGAVRGDGSGEPSPEISSPEAVQSLGEQLLDAAKALGQAADRLEDIRLAIRAGRMLPEEERVGSNNGFKRDWTEHLESVRESLTAGRRAADTAADRLRQADDDSAADIRQALRGH